VSNRKHEQQWWRNFDGFEQWLLWEIAIHSVSVGGTGAPSFDLQVHACWSSCASQSRAPHSEELLSPPHMSVFNPLSFLYDELVFTVLTLLHVLIKELNFSVPRDKKRLGCFYSEFFPEVLFS